MDGEFLLFINHRQAATCGHVGWGFKEPGKDNYVFGSTDHLTRHKYMDLIAWINYMHVEPGEDNDWWSDSGSKAKMVELMSDSKTHIWYHAYKIFPVALPKFEQAKKIALDFKNQGWSVFSNNCVQQTYEIAKVYGVGGEILNPWSNSFLLVPNIWFKMVPGEVVTLNEV